MHVTHNVYSIILTDNTVTTCLVSSKLRYKRADLRRDTIMRSLCFSLTVLGSLLGRSLESDESSTAGLLVSGGNTGPIGGTPTAELFIHQWPGAGGFLRRCSLPNLSSPFYSHTQNNFLSCGGSSSSKACEVPHVKHLL